MTVEPTRFVEAMTGHWQGALRNVPSEALKATWRQMATTFNDQIAACGTPLGQRWKVLQPATGTGKSQGTALYCSMIPEINHPGVLIVTRLKCQADELAETINKLAGKDIAAAFHSDSERHVASLAFVPVLIITHRAYELGLDAINKGQPERSNWSAFTTWEASSRKLVIIDEALDIVEEAQITAEDVRVLRSILPIDIAQRFPSQMAALDMVEQVLTKMALVAKAQEHEKVLWRGEMPLPEGLDFTPLRRALREVRLDHKLLRRTDLGENKRLAQRYDEIIKNVHLTLSNWNFYAKKMAQHTMNTARLIVPEDVTGAIVLDATASSNLIYQLFEEKADVLPAPANARRYDNVTLHVSKGHAVGKVAMAKVAPQEASKLLANLATTLGRDRKVFVCCHHRIEPHVIACEHPFKALDAGHWGAIDGRNTWENFDTAVIFGLPYRDNIWSANCYMALQGLQSSAWLQSEGDRPFKTHRDIRHALSVGQLVVNIVQAVNRVQCRRVIDGEGNCLPTDVFILLPGDRTGDEVLSGVVANMPGIRVADWQYDHAKRKARRSNHEESLARYAVSLSPGKREASKIRGELAIPSATWERLTSKLRDPSTGLYQRLQAAACFYTVERAGRTERGYLVKG